MMKVLFWQFEAKWLWEVAGVKTREDFYCNTLPSTSLFYTLFMVFNLASSSSLFLFVAIQPFLHKYNYFHQWGLLLQNYLSISLLHVLSVPIWWHCWDDDIEKMVVMDCFICMFFLCFMYFFVYPLFGTESQGGCRCLVRCSKCQKSNQRFLKYPNIKLIANIYHLS